MLKRSQNDECFCEVDKESPGKGAKWFFSDKRLEKFWRITAEVTNKRHSID